MGRIPGNMAADFELGRCKLLRSGANYLHQSLQINGDNLVWTDGESVWLSPVKFRGNCKGTAFLSKERCLVRKFESVVIRTLCSAVTKGSSGYYIAVVLKEKVVVLWRKIGEAVATLVKEYFTECLPRGCEWHPSISVLSVLSKRTAVLLCFADEHECNVVSIQTSHRSLHTCAWSENGRKLAVAVEDSLCIFSFTDLSKPNHFTYVQWNSLQMTGKIKYIVPWQTSSYIIATELPLHKLCQSDEKDGDLFEVPNVRDSDESRGMDSSSSVVCSGDVDFTILTQSVDQGKNSLLNLKLRKPQFEAFAISAQIIALCCEEMKPREICRTSIKGLISPDLLLFQPATNTVVVGSHCCSRLYFYSLYKCDTSRKTEFVEKEKPLKLDPVTKPKGLCLIPGHRDNFLVLLGKPKQTSNMTAFPPSAVYEQYNLSLKSFSTVLNEGNRQTEDTFFQQVTNLSIANDVVVPNSDLSPLLRLPNGSVFMGHSESVQSVKAPLISELELNEDGELLANSKETHKGVQSRLFREIQDIKTTMMANVSQINERLSALDERVNKIDSDWNKDHSHTPYPLQGNAEIICVVWTDELTGAMEQENFLLDKGRLKLKTIQQAFNASLIRICIGDVPCIVSSGEDGFIPIGFLSGSTVQMSGHSNHQLTNT